MHYLDKLPYAKHQAEPDECFPGTRAGVISEIIQWFAQPVEDTAERLFWLYGVAGCGKSTIAQTVAQQLSAQRRCVSFFFDASRQADAGLKHVFATISRDIADLNNNWKASLIRTLRGSAKASNSSTVKSQFENLILEPAKGLDSIGPILIIIDALDESGSLKERAPLLQALTSITKLSPYFRFLVTSRPESDIVDALGDHNYAWVRPSRLDQVDQKSTNRDIWNFVHHHLLQVSMLKDEWIDDWADEITARSDQLFQWAFTACKYIIGDGSVGWNSLERLQEFLESNTYTGLDALYMAILDRLCTFQPGDATSHRFQVIMGRVLSVREPLSIEALSALWSDEEDRSQVRSILSPLGSLLQGVSGKQEPIQPLHASFIDFLTVKERSGRYWVDIQQQDEMLLRASLREMKKLLRFNICKLETSYLFNRFIPNLVSQIQQFIPPHLAYACCFWLDHLHNITPTNEWCKHIYVFMQRNLLFWLEVLSLLNKTERAHIQLLLLMDWLECVVRHL
jgi:hypothetical protein